MLLLFLVIYQIPQILSICIQECEGLDIINCMNCLLETENHGNHSLCNLWSSTECSFGEISLVINSERIIFSSELHEKDKGIDFKHKGSSKDMKTLIIAGEENTVSHLNCSFMLNEDSLFTFGILLKIFNEEKPFLIWFIGIISSSESRFKGFLTIEELWNFGLDIHCFEKRNVREEDCENLSHICPVWMRPNENYPLQRRLDSCSTECSACTGPGYDECISCNTGYYFLNYLCLPSCPSNYETDLQLNYCNLLSLEAYSLLFKNQILIDYINYATVGSQANPYPQWDSNDPIPSIYRGYYFTLTSQITHDNLIISPFFTVNLWINPSSLAEIGSIALKYDQSSSTNYFNMYFDTSSTVFTVMRLKDTSQLTISGGQVSLNKWQNIAVTGTVRNQKTQVASYMNGSLIAWKISDNASPYIDSGKLIIGYSTSVKSFVGFLWAIKFFSDSSRQYAEWKTSGCVGGCSTCPSELVCPDTCSFGSYLNSTVCDPCLDICDQGCRSSNTCKLCLYKECSTCSTFDEECINCVENASLVNGICTCKINAIWIDEACNLCDVNCKTCRGTYYFYCTSCNDGLYLVDGICLNYCPFLTNPCSSSVSPKFNITFDGSFKGNYDNFLTSVSGATYQFFNSPDLGDPIPAYSRGLYFDNGKYLMTSQNVYINFGFSLGLWVYALHEGTILSKQGQISLNSNAGFSVYLTDPLATNSFTKQVGSQTFSGWTYLFVSVGYSNGYTQIYGYINDQLKAAESAKYYLFRDSGDSPLYLGGSPTGTFIGFIYSFTFWNAVITDLTSELSRPCGSALSISCLQTCDINQYYSQNDSSCLYCNNCYTGCVRKYSCNICYDPLCSACSGFWSGMCAACVDNASGNPCACNANYISPDGFSCTLKCFTGCSSCLSTSYTSCTSCAQNYFLYQMICYTTCPQGTISNSVTKTCDKDFPMSISLDFYALASLPSSYSSASGKTPYFISDRGWRFFPQSYISTSVQLSSYITISMWICFTAYTSIDTIFYMSRDWGISYNGSNKQLVFNTGPIVWSQAQSLSALDINTWHFLFISTIHNSDGTIKQLITLDSTSLTHDSLTPASDFIFQDKGGSKYIGTQFDWNNRGYTSFTGYMYWLHVYNDGLYDIPSNEIPSSSCPSCSVCPSSSFCLPTNCAYNEYYDSECHSCNSACINGCNNGNDCTLCSMTGCNSCTGTNTCGSCKGDFVFIDNNCQCPYTYAVKDPDLFTCNCTSSLTFNSVCVSSCPTGTSDNLSGACILYASQGLVFSLALTQIKGIVHDSSSSGIDVLAGISSDFYPSYDAYDPIPASKRGYYFNGNSFMQLPPNIDNSSKSLTIAADFSYSMWLWSQNENGVILAKQSSDGPYTTYLSIKIVGLKIILSFYDSMLSSSVSFTSRNSINADSWCYIGFSLSYKFPYSQVTYYINSSFDTPKIIKHPFQDLDSNYSILIAAMHTGSSAYSSFYTGFVYSIKIWNTIVNPTLYDISYSCGSSCSFCPLSSSSCLPSQPISNYYDSSSSTWNLCWSSCQSTGCVRNDVFCNICDDLLCKVCEDWTGCVTCISKTKPNHFPCECLSGYIYDPIANECACFPFCEICSSSHNGDCSSCKSGYYLNPENLCLYLCPMGYAKQSDGTCLQTAANSMVLHYLLNKLANTFADNVSGLLAYMGSTDSYLGPNDPQPVYQSGFYFSGNSYLKLPPNSADSKEVILGNNHSLLFWVRPTSLANDSIIFSKENASQVHSGFKILSTGKLHVNYEVYDDLSGTAENMISEAGNINLNAWYNIIIVFSWTSHTNQISLYINGVAQAINNLIAYQNTFFMDIPSDSFIVGGSNIENYFFNGFIFEMVLYNYAISSSIAAGLIKTTCLCPACGDFGNECLRSCSYLQYYNNATSSCTDCDSSCTNGCVRNGDCSMSVDLLCAAEIGFQPSECTSCVAGATGAGTTCACLQNYVYDSSSKTCKCDTNLYPCGRCDSLCTSCLNYNYFTCSSCTGSGVYLNQVCLNECPYGLFSNSDCASKTSPVIDQWFNGDFQGSYGIFRTAQSDSNYYFFNSPETLDPVPAYNRGLYFSNGKFLDTTTPIYLSSWFTMGLWIYTIDDGDVIYKIGTFTLSSNLKVNAVLTTFKGSSTLVTTPINFSGWCHIAFSMEYVDDSAKARFYLNSDIKNTISTQYALFRDNSSQTLLLGKSQTSSFVGFIYAFTLWNQATTDFFTNMPCSGITLDASCLWACDIFMYNEGGNYVTCNNCYNGCVRGKSCNICKDPLCKICTGFGDQCSECVENASGTPCACLAGFSSPGGFSCTSGCARGCSSCLSTSYSDCTSCQPGYFLYQMICYKSCPAGTLSNSVTNSCDQDSVFSISLDFYSLATLPSEYTAVGADYVNNRGWYFEPADYVSTENKLSYFFGVSLWIFFTGFTNEDTIFYVGRDYGFSYKGSSQTLNFKTSYSSFVNNPATLSLNSWHYIYFSIFREDVGKLTETVIIDSSSVFMTISFANTYIDPDANYVKYIGSCPEWAVRKALGFSGYIYFFHAFRDAPNLISLSEYITSGCPAGCSACPPSLLCLPTNCQYNQYINSNCVNCLSNCMHGCANGNDCTLCSLTGCDTCTGTSTCGLCHGDFLFIDGQCACPYTFSVLDPLVFACYCSSNLQFQSICMNFCPTGTNGNQAGSCVLDSHQGLIFSLKLNKIEGLVKDTVNNFNVLSGSSDSFYPTYDSYDPIPAYKRGYYFNGNSLMQLPPNINDSSYSLNFATAITFSIWIWPTSTTSSTKQVIFTKQNSSMAALIEVSISLPKLYVVVHSFLSQQTYISYHETNTQGWNYAAFSLSYSFPYTQVTFYINSQLDMATPAKSPLQDSSIAYSILIGAQHASSSTYSDFFTGFIYSMNIWIVPTNPTLNDVFYNCNPGCTICPVGYAPNCLANEPISNYYNSSTSSWLQCSSSCSSKGCVRNDDTCNLCDDPLCASCNDWSGCLACIDNCDPVQPPCTCKSGFWFYVSFCTYCPEDSIPEGSTCVCKDLNSTYNASTNQCVCNDPYASYNFTSNKCTCNSGYRLYNDFCTICPDNATPQRSSCICNIDNASYDSTLAQCVCNSGYRLYNGFCTTCPENAIPNGATCTCSISNASYDSSSNKCVCNANYWLDNGLCIKCPENASREGSTCICNIANAKYDSTLNQCVCNNYYYMNQGTCIACVNYLDTTNIAASFRNSYSEIQFTFNIPADRSPYNCSSSFDSSTLAGFGLDYSCSFASDFSSLKVLLGHDYTFSTENAIFKPGALISSVPLCGKSKLQLSIPVALQGDVPTPKFTYIAPKILEISCQDLLLDVIVDKGLPYEVYKWTLSSNPPSSVISSFSTEYSNSYTALSIKKENLTEGIIHASFSMKNNFGGISTIDKEINATASPTLIINIDPLLASSFDRLKSYTVSVGSITSCNISDNLNITWSISGVSNNASSIDESTFWSAQKSQYLLNIPPKTLPASSTIDFKVFAKDLTYNIPGETSFSIETQSSDPIIVFNRTDGDSGVSQNLVVDAGDSYDPDYNSNFLYQWSCQIHGSSTSCSDFIHDFSSSVLIVPANTLTLGAVYNFTLNFTKITTNPVSTAKSSQKSITITAINKTVPPVNMVEVSSSIPNIANPDTTYRIEIKGTFSSVDWSLNSSSEISYSTPTNSNYLVIPPNSLASGFSYTLLASVDNEFSFTWTFYVNNPPNNGKLMVVPSSGLEMSTIFTVAALNWEDPENNLPLQYSFGYYISDAYQAISAKNLSSLIFTNFPYSPGNITISVDIYDSLASKTNKISYVTINENPNIDQYIDYRMNLPVLNPQAVPGFASELSALVLNRDNIINNEYSDVDSQMQSAYDSIIDKVNLYVEAMDKYNEDSYTTVFYMLYVATLNPNINSYDNINKISDIADFMIKNNDKLTIDDGQMQVFAGICDNNFQLDSNGAINQTNTVNTIDENVRKISTVLLSGMVTGESKTFIEDKFATEVSKTTSSELSNYASQIKNASVTLGHNVSDYFNENEGIGVIITIYDPALDITVKPSFSLVSYRLINNITFQEVHLNNTSYNTINIPVHNYDVPVTKDNPIYCTYLENNETRWHTTGCVLDSYNATNVICSCNHLTIFSSFFSDAWSTASGSNIGDTVNVDAFNDIDWATNAIGLYFCITVLFIYAVLSAIACNMDRLERKKKENAPELDPNNSHDLRKNDDPRVRMKRKSTIIKFDLDESEIGTRDEKLETARSEESPTWIKESQEMSIDTTLKTKNSFDMSIIKLDTADVINVKDIKHQVKEEKPLKRYTRALIFIAKNHDFVTIFTNKENFTHFSRLTSYMITLLGNMYFIGLFYQSKPKGSDYSIGDFSSAFNNYSFQDFWILVYSSSIMLLVGILLNYLSKSTPLPSTDDTLYKSIKKNNLFKLIAFYLISFGLLFYFCWSIILFSIQFELNVTYLWICNTSVSYGTNLFVVSFAKVAFKAFLIWIFPIIIMIIGTSNTENENNIR
ncbi:unnamed protein product [Blepharisma stoltei]|uniref:TNFR-Cys domain-containing protein n=1 Tax=Blepharisma stoltei TaxID=1481888 RepID=A0AAU9J796_9CILI|nr:unnamed protein product [Blepharisma stoltei]